MGGTKRAGDGPAGLEPTGGQRHVGKTALLRSRGEPASGGHRKVTKAIIIRDVGVDVDTKEVAQFKRDSYTQVI